MNAMTKAITFSPHLKNELAKSLGAKTMEEFQANLSAMGRSSTRSRSRSRTHSCPTPAS